MIIFAKIRISIDYKDFILRNVHPAAFPERQADDERDAGGCAQGGRPTDNSSALQGCVLPDDELAEGLHGLFFVLFRRDRRRSVEVLIKYVFDSF